MSSIDTSPLARPNAGAEPKAEPATAPNEPVVRVYVWDAVVRSTHWAIALSMLILAITGVYIGRPYLSVVGEARDSFTTGMFRVVHMYAAIAFTVAVCARLVWMVIRPGFANWRELVPLEKERLKGLLTTFRFYIFLRDVPARSPGHNPLAGAAYIAVFGLYLVMITTGLGLYGASAHVDSPATWFAFLQDWWGGAQTARWVHHIAMWLLIGFATHHLFSGLLMAMVERVGTMESIFSGYKWVPKSEDEHSKQRFRRKK